MNTEMIAVEVVVAVEEVGEEAGKIGTQRCPTFTKFISLQLKVPSSYSVQKWQGCTHIRSETMNCFARSAKFRSMSHKHGN